MLKNTVRFLAGFNCLLVCALVACGPSAATTPVQSTLSQGPTPSPKRALAEEFPEFLPTPIPLPVTLSREIGNPTQAPLVLPAGSPTPAASTTEPIALKVLTPIDGSGIEVASTRVMGITSAKKVEINGVPVDVSIDGSFQRDMPLREGVNLLEVVASEPSGRTRAEQIVVFMVYPIAALPFSLLYPKDGLVVTEASIPVVGVTSPGAIVGVNGIPVEVNELGVFSTTVPLKMGDNLIEVVATDIREVRFQTVVVFYTP